jgi:hypothetical protein
LKLNLLDCLPAVVGDVHIDIETGTADPDLPMKACGNSNDLNSSVAGPDPFVGSSQGAGERHESLFSCLVVNFAVGKAWVKLQRTVIYGKNSNVFGSSNNVLLPLVADK